MRTGIDLTRGIRPPPLLRKDGVPKRTSGDKRYLHPLLKTMAPIADDFGGQRARLVKLTRRAMKAVGKQDVLWPILFTASFIVYLVQSQSLRTFAREFVRLLDKVL